MSSYSGSGSYSTGSGRGRWILMATVLASGTTFLLAAATSIALPKIQSSFGSNLSGLQWVVDAPLLCLASLLLIGGSLGDRFGRKRVFLTGIAVFGAAGLASALSRSIGHLIAFQAIQGAGAALMVPQSLAIINVCFPEAERGKVIGLWAGLSGGIGSLGPWVGGWLVQTFSWPVVFFMTAPVSTAAFVAAYIFVPESRNPGAHRLDWQGTLCIFAGLSGLAYGLISGPAGWTRPLVILALSGGTLACILFVFVESRREEAMVPLRIFRNPLVSGANLVTLLLYFALNGVSIFTILNLQQAQGYSPATAGVAFLPLVLLITFLSGPAGSLADRTGPRLQMILGPMLVAASAGLLAFTGTNTGYVTGFLPGFALLGIGMALVIAPLTKSALSVAPELSGAASGVNNAAARIAALLAVALLGGLMLSAFSAHLAATIGNSGLSPDQQQLILSQSDRLGGIVIPEMFDPSATAIARRVIGESLVHAFRQAMITSSILAFCAGLISIITIRRGAKK